MRAFFLFLGVLVFAVIAVGAAALFAMQSMDLARYQGLVADRVEAATGRALAIDGEVRVAGLLRPAISVSGVRFANTPGAADPDMVRIAEIEAQLRLWPLVFGRVVLDRLVVRGARILMETDAIGGANWQFTPAGETAAAQAAARADEDADDDGGVSIPAGIGEIEITDSTLEVRAAGAEPVLLGIDSATLGAASANAQVTLAAALTWDGAPVAITARSASAAALARSFPNLPLTFSVSAFGATLAADGRIAAGTAEFAVTAAADRLGAIKEKFGVPLASDGPFAFSGGVRAGADGGRIDGFTLRLGQSDLGGDLAVDLTGARPRVTGRLAADRIAAADFAAPAAPAEPAANAPAAAAPGRLIPDQPLPPVPLDLADAQIAVAVADLALTGMSLADVRLAVNLSDGVLNLAIANASLPKGGAISGAVGAHVEGQAVVVGVDLAGDGVALAGLAGGALAEAIEGAVDAKVHLEGRGTTPAALAASLDGSVSVLMGAGRARAAVLDTFVGGITTVLQTLGGGDDGWTVVNCAAAAFDITAGVAESQVLLFDSRAATVAGHGTIDLRTEALDLVVTPEAKVATLSLSTPVLVGGTLAHPTFAPDPVAVARRLAGVLGVFVFPPAAIAGLGDLGNSDNACIDLAAAGEARDDAAPAGEEPAPLPALPGAEDVERAIEGLGRGLQNLLGGGR